MSEERNINPEDNDANNKQDQDPVTSGKKAIDAARVASNDNKPPEEKEKDEKKDAEKWRNEG